MSDDAPLVAARLSAVRDTPPSIDEAVRAVSHSAAGGIAVFVGTVRDHADAGSVTLLEYEAYTSMAEREMRAIMDEIGAEIPGTRLAAVHRVGSLQVGDIAVVCAASAPHREEAFSAVRLLIDRIKQRAPIWKREHGPAGPYWVGWTAHP